nr:MAG TPA: hypothetical protein [Caudoviricetes sp.]
MMCRSLLRFRFRTCLSHYADFSVWNEQGQKFGQMTTSLNLHRM